MNIQVVFTDGVQKAVQVNPESSIEDVMSESTGLQLDLLLDYSLAWKNRHSNSFTNIDWLLPGLPLSEQGVEQGSTLLLCKKYMTSSPSELQHLQAPFLGWLYSQLLHTFVKGLFKCSTFQAAQIAAIACQVEGLSGNSLQQQNGESLSKVLPKRFSVINGMDQLVIKALRKTQHLSEEAAQRLFVQRLQRQETFGMAFYTATFEENGTRFPALIGIGPENISKLDRDQMEVLDQWDIDDLVKCSFDIGTFTMEIGQEVVTMETSCGHMIHDYISGMQNAIKPQALVGQKMQKKSPPPKPPPKPATQRLKMGSSPNMSKKPVPPPKPIKKPPPPPTPLKPSHSAASPSPSSQELEERSITSERRSSPPINCGGGTKLSQESEDRMSPVSSPVSGGGGGGGGKLGTDSSSGDELCVSSPSGISRSRGGRNMAIKRRKQSNFTEEEFVPQDYEALYSVVNDTVDEVSRLLGDENWAAHMHCLQDENPIYDKIVASDTETLLRSSSVTYSALSETFKRSIRKKGSKDKKAKKISVSNPPASPKPSRPQTSPKPARISSVSSDKSKKAGITKLGVVKSTDGTSVPPVYASSIAQEIELEYDYVVVQRGAVRKPFRLPTPDKVQPTKRDATEPAIANSASTPVQAFKPPILPKPAVVDKAKAPGSYEDDVFYDELRVVKKKQPLTKKISLPNITQITSHTTKKPRHYSEINRSGPQLRKNQSREKFESAIAEETSIQETILPPPKPPRLKQRELEQSSSSISEGVGSSSEVRLKQRELEQSSSISEGVESCSSEVRLKQRELVQSSSISEGVESSSEASVAVREGEDEIDACIQQKSRMLKPGEILQDYVTLQREFRVFFIKLPSGAVHTELANLTVAVGKLIARLCVLLCLEDPSQYLLFVEGSALNSIMERENVSDDDQLSYERSGVGKRAAKRTPSPFEHFSRRSSFTILPNQGTTPILLNPGLSFQEQNISSTRILALRPKPGHTERVPCIPLRVPDWVKFHQCWLAVVQGNQPCSLQDAIKLAAMQYQIYFKDRTEINSIIGFCKSSDFLPLEYAPLSGLEEKIFTEQQTLQGLSRQEAQEAYINACTSLSTYGTIFFPCKELKKRVFQSNKLSTVVLGINKEGIMRVDPKTKEVLDLWPYPALKNWGNSKNIFLLDFSDRSYPIKTNQAKWMNELISFHVKAIVKSKQSPPATTVVAAALSGRDRAEIVFRHYEMDPRIGVEEIYRELFAAEENSSSYDNLTAQDVQHNYHILTSSNDNQITNQAEPNAPPQMTEIQNNMMAKLEDKHHNYHSLEQWQQDDERWSDHDNAERRQLNGDKAGHSYHTLEEWSSPVEPEKVNHHYHKLERKAAAVSKANSRQTSDNNGYDCLHKPPRRNEAEYCSSNRYNVLEQSSKENHYHVLEPTQNQAPVASSTHTYTEPHTNKKTNHAYHVLEKPPYSPLNSRTPSPSALPRTPPLTRTPPPTSVPPLPSLFSQGSKSSSPYRVTRIAPSMEGSDPSHEYQRLYAVPEAKVVYDVPQPQQDSEEAIYDEPEAVLSPKVLC